ncbi:DUF5719 family protein [Brooklawnia sp.]|uniref:DUF5719 family protein n=1 Tax=Brooklawnia sp. TaxID=2699740 RepID=UPI00311D9039
MNPRRGLPSDPDDQFGSDETELEMSAIRRGLWLDESQDVVAPRRASRALADGEDEDPTLSSIDLAPRHAGPPEDVDSADDQQGADATPGRPMTDKARPAQNPSPPAANTGRGASRWPLTVVGITVLGLGTAFGAGAIPAEPAPLSGTIPLVTAISRICPVPAGGEASLLAFTPDGGIDVRQIGDDQATTQSGRLELPGQTEPLLISPAVAESGVTGGSLVTTENQQWWGACEAGADDQYVQLPGGAEASLTIVNPESVDALVDVTLSGPDGEITGDGLRGITVGANSQHVIDLDPLAGSVDALGARVRTSLGRVGLSAQVARNSGADFATGTLQSTDLIIPAVPARPSKTVILLTNPGTSRAVVQLEGLSEAGRFTLPGFESVTLNAQRTAAVDLTDAIGGLPVSLLISSDDPIAASAVVTASDDFGIEPAQAADESVAGQNLVGVVAGPGSLQLANPGNREALVVVDWGEGQANANLRIPAGTVASIPIPEAAATARATSTAPLFGALMLSAQGRSGFAIAQLEPAARARSTMPVEIDVGLGR